MIVTVTWGHINPPKDFVSAWDAARTAFGAVQFDALPRDEQTQAVRNYVNRVEDV